jgi:hypothetical protein
LFEQHLIMDLVGVYIEPLRYYPSIVSSSPFPSNLTELSSQKPTCWGDLVNNSKPTQHHYHYHHQQGAITMPLALPFRAGVLPAARTVQAAAQATVTRGQLSRALIMARQRNQTEPSIDDDHQPRKGTAIPATPIDAIILDGPIDQSPSTEVVTAYDFRPPRTIDQITGVPRPLS